MMSNDLDWTSALGEAVAADQTAVMDAVQAFRRKAEGAGNLKTDDKQIVEVEEDVVKIVQADPQVIYVPTYEPQVVVVQQPAPVYPTYYPTPYPCYYYPYPPGYSFAAGFFWGATVAYAFNWHGGSIHNDIDINVNRNTNINGGNNINNRPTNIDRGTSNQMAQQGRGSWQSGQSPSNVRQGRAPTATTRPANTGGGAQAGTRPSTGNTGGGAAANRPSTTPAQRPSGSTGSSATRPQTSNSAANRSSYVQQRLALQHDVAQREHGTQLTALAGCVFGPVERSLGERAKCSRRREPWRRWRRSRRWRRPAVKQRSSGDTR